MSFEFWLNVAEMLIQLLAVVALIALAVGLDRWLQS